MRVLDKKGRGYSSDAIAAIDWLLTYGSYSNIRVVILPLGKAVEALWKDPSLNPATMKARLMRSARKNVPPWAI